MNNNKIELVNFRKSIHRSCTLGTIFLELRAYVFHSFNAEMQYVSFAE